MLAKEQRLVWPTFPIVLHLTFRELRYARSRFPLYPAVGEEPSYAASALGDTCPASGRPGKECGSWIVDLLQVLRAARQRSWVAKKLSAAG